ncbi:nucleoporin-62 C-terminal-like protein [Hyperolius riggenbachi]|uniref:nucleoporin-62 C-terminal-like protein n=1 Tax=Hyperolius riggenbachi TaxID=752182 RepID=UPI0035A3035C
MSGFSFGTGTAAGGFNFGAAKTTASTAPTGFSFGTSTTAQPTGFSFGNQQTTSSALPQPSGLFSFSSTAPSAAATTTGFTFGTPTTSASTASGLTFGTNAAKFAVNPQPANSNITGTAQPAQNLAFGFGTAPAQTQPATAGSFAFAGQPATTVQSTTNVVNIAPAAAATAATTTATAQSGFSFQSPAFCMAPSATSATPTATTAPVQASAIQQTSNLFSKPPEAASAPATQASTSSTSSLGALLATSAPSLFSLSTTTAPASLSVKPQITGAAQPSTSGTATTSIVSAPAMTYVQLENLINKWSLELEDQEKHFLQQATQVNAWDRMLIHNGERITTLHKEVEKVKLDQKRLDQELDFILSQQKELEDILTPLEESVKEQSGTIYLQHADEEREKTYKLAENIDAQLKRMAQDLKDVIEHLNTSADPGDISNPLQQICKILNAHMDSLQWVDQNSALLQRKVEQVTKECESRRKEQERGYPITFD